VAQTYHIAQNLPYGTHIVKFELTSTGTYSHFGEFTFHQPKMPPIPEDAVVLADYMLMADFVKQTDAESTQISKGVRYCNGSRDHFYGGAGTATLLAVKSGSSPWGLTGGGSPGSTNTGIWKLPFFGTTGLSLVEQSQQAHSVTLGGSATTETALDNSVQPQGDIISIAETVTLGQTNIETTLITGSYHFFGHYVASPIHTSSHYQTFETPFLHELVGGDRNMEQTNLVVTPDGKTWDEVTRDVGYLGNTVLSAVSGYAGWVHDAEYWIHDEMRGRHSNHGDQFNKDFAIAYDRHICLKDGWYTTTIRSLRRPGGGAMYIKINGITVVHLHQSSGGTYHMVEGHLNIFMKRGDYIQIYGEGHGGELATLYITKQNRD